MNSVFLRVLALVLAISAVLLAWNGYRMNSRLSAENTKPNAVTKFRIAVAARPLPIGTRITASDIKLIEQTQSVAQSYDDPASLIDKVISTEVEQNAPFLAWKHFSNSEALASTLRSGERGVAIKVSEIIGAGGFLKPGDHVDVLLYLRKEQNGIDLSSAGEVLSNIRVIAYGENIGISKKPDEQQAKQATAIRSEASHQDDKKPAKDSRSAVLAIPEKDVVKLMLADSSGQIRLALRSDQDIAKDKNTSAATFNIEELFAKSTVIKPPTTATTPTVSKAPYSVKANTARHLNSNDAITVHRGTAQEVVYIK